jgi:maltooligosyltrehalose trehalohydrolase
MNFAYRLPFGAEILAPQRARFRWWAPDLESATLEIEHTASLPMRRAESGWFELETNIDVGSRYRFRINNTLTVPDPASRQQSNGVHNWSVLVDPNDFNWRHPQWNGRAWQEIIIYELHAGCFGGFLGIKNKLHELVQLGVTAIELMPIADFGGFRNWGYDGVLPFSPASAYGTPKELKELIDSAHGLGLCVYLDVVYNHFGPDGNYLHLYASPFFDPKQKSPWGSAIDFSRTEVREFFTQNALYWLLEYRFDGLRIDAAHAISDASWLDEMAISVRAAVEPHREIHLMLENELNRADHLRPTTATKSIKLRISDEEKSPSGTKKFDAQWNDDWHNALHVLLTGEREGYYANYIDQTAKKLARGLAEGFIYQGEPSPTHNGNLRGTSSKDLPPTSFINFLQNHDQIGNRAYGERLISLISVDNLRIAIALQLLSPAIPLLFMGEEFGSRSPFLFFTDFSAELADAVREGRRQEFAAFTAFKQAQERERIPDPNALDTFEHSIPQDDKTPQSRAMYDFYQQLLQLRRDYIIPRLTTCSSIGAQALSNTAFVARWKFGDGVILSIAVNFGDTNVAIAPLIFPALFELPAGASQHAHTGLLTNHCIVVTLKFASQWPAEVREHE